MVEKKEKDNEKETYKVVFSCLVKAHNSQTAIVLAREQVEDSKEEELHCQWL